MPRFSSVPIALALCAMLACERPPSAPTPPAADTTVPPPPPTDVVVAGTVTSSITGKPLAGVSLDLGGRLTSSADDGRFTYALPPGDLPASVPLRLTGPHILERSLRLALPGAGAFEVDVVPLGDGFDLDYYRRLVRDSLDESGSLRPIRRWIQPPRLYVRTVDEAGQLVPASTLEPVVSALEDEASAWTGGRFGLAGVEMGTGTRERETGWITVKWVAPLNDTSFCARAQIAVDGGWIEFNYLQQQGCGCGQSRISPKTARHEMGHALGFFHTGEQNDVMWNKSVCDDRRPSARERLHAAVAYGRPNGNTDLDNDPVATIRSMAPPLVIVD